MSQPIRFSAEAAAELQAAAAWYEEQRRGFGDTFLSAVEEAADVLADWPTSGPVVAGVSDDVEVRRVPVARFPYHLAYIVTSDHIRVLAVAHDRRRPGYWVRRLHG